MDTMSEKQAHDDTPAAHELETAATPAHAARRGISPALLVFLIFPLIGLAAAAALFVNGGGSAPSNGGLPTPAAVTLPPMPTPVNLAETPIIDFRATSLDGEFVNAADYIGRVIFLNFWATYCEPCKREMPALEQFSAAQPADGAVVLAVNVQDRRVDVEAFLDEYGITGLNIILDPDGSIADQYGIFQLPVTFVIDTNGVIRYPKYGEITLAELNAYTDALSAERSG
jgi:thiol-disulfide isomerase/thioredoxin